MPINPAHLLRDLSGNPMPPDWLKARLQRDNDGIGVFYQKGSWVITEAWKENDPRRARIQTESMDPRYAFDICGYLPVNCSLEEAPGFIANMLRGFDERTWTGVRHAVNTWNNTLGEGQDAEQFDTVMSAVSDAMGQHVGSAGIFSAADVPKHPDTPNVPDVPFTPRTATPQQLESLAKARATAKANRDAAKALEPAGV